MKTITQHIKEGNFKNVYLLYGSEDYLRKQYRDKLKKSIVDQSMNYNYFEGKNISVKTIIDIAETLPFFSERRLIVVENSGFFSSAQEELATYIKEMPETTYIVFVEKEVDKRNKLFKTVSQIGYCSNMTAPDEKSMKIWITKLLKKEHSYMSDQTITYFLERIDTDMENVRKEMDKLVTYTYGNSEITRKDIDDVCIVYTENQVFDLVKAVAEKKQSEALAMYYELLAAKEAPMKILYWITRQFNQLYQIKELEEHGYPDRVIAEHMKIRDFIVRKNKALTQNYSIRELRKAVEICVQREEDVKTGKMNDKMAVELLIIRFSMN